MLIYSRQIYTQNSTLAKLHPLSNKLIYGNNHTCIGTSYRSISQRKRSSRNIIKQKQPRTTYTGELHQRSLSVAKILHFFEGAVVLEEFFYLFSEYCCICLLRISLICSRKVCGYTTSRYCP